MKKQCCLLSQKQPCLMEIGNQYVNYASLKNRREIRGQGKPQIKKKGGGGG